MMNTKIKHSWLFFKASTLQELLISPTHSIFGTNFSSNQPQNYCFSQVTMNIKIILWKILCLHELHQKSWKTNTGEPYFKLFPPVKVHFHHYEVV